MIVMATSATVLVNSHKEDCCAHNHDALVAHMAAQGSIVQALLDVVVSGSLPSPVERFGSNHIANTADTKRAVTNRKALYR